MVLSIILVESCGFSLERTTLQSIVQWSQMVSRSGCKFPLCSNRGLFGVCGDLDFAIFTRPKQAGPLLLFLSTLGRSTKIIENVDHGLGYVSALRTELLTQFPGSSKNKKGCNSVKEVEIP